MKWNCRRAAPTAQVWEKRRFLRPAQGRQWCPCGILCPASLYPQESSQSPSLQFAPASQPGCATPARVLLASEFSFPSNPKADAKQNQTEAQGQGHRIPCLKEGCLSGRTEGWWGGASWGVVPTHFMPHLFGCHSNPQGFLNICVYHECMQAVSISLAKALRY